MRNRVDVELTKNWGGYEKGHVLMNLNRSFARKIQDGEKAGKIIGDTKTAENLENAEAAKAEFEAAMNEKVAAVKAKSDKDVEKAKAETEKVKEKAKTDVEKAKAELANAKADLAKVNKDLTASEKMLKTTQNKLDKLAKQRETK